MHFVRRLIHLSFLLLIRYKAPLTAASSRRLTSRPRKERFTSDITQYMRMFLSPLHSRHLAYSRTRRSFFLRQAIPKRTSTLSRQTWKMQPGWGFSHVTRR
jgi:hypothetical protein